MLWYRARLVLSPSTTYLPTPFCVSTVVLIHSVYLYTIYVYTVYMRAHGAMMLVLCFAALLGATAEGQQLMDRLRAQVAQLRKEYVDN